MSCTSTKFLRGRVFLLPAIVFAFLAFASASAPPSQNGLILRVRMTDGSMQRIQIPSGKEDTITLKDALSALLSDEDNGSDEDKPMIRIGTSTSNIKDDSATISSLGLKQGSLISLIKKQSTKQPKREATSTTSKPTSKKWNPFPDLAKDYEAAVRKAKTRRATKTGMSYGDIAKMQASLHNVQPQDIGPITRIYVCAKSCARFHTNGMKKTGTECRIGLLLGTVNRERVDLKPKAKTSLSSQTESSQYCLAAKVHALWEPPLQRPSQTMYDTKSMPFDFKTDAELQRVFRIADLLGLQPIGWIFSYNDNRHKQEDSLPVYAPDAKTGALLQIANMQKLGREEGAKFVTLSMQADTGATEAFQLSDVCVQMMAEDLWQLPQDNDKKGASRFVSTKHPVIVDGKELKELDSVLCLVNTALLSHDGAYAGTAVNSVKKSGAVTNKVKKTILASLDTNDDTTLLETLCDLNLLVCLDKSLAPADMDQMCSTVRKFARGQKRGTQLDERLKLLLRSVLDH